jgi:hypothetical protein
MPGSAIYNRQPAKAGIEGPIEMNIVEYFEMRKREVDEQLDAIESGRVLRLVQESREGPIDVTHQHKLWLQQASKDYWRAAENLRRINSSQLLR